MLEQRRELLKRSYWGGEGGEGKERVKREIRFAGTRGPFLWGPKMCSGGPLPQGFVRKYSVRVEIILVANGSTAEERVAKI